MRENKINKRQSKKYDKEEENVMKEKEMVRKKEKNDQILLYTVKCGLRKVTKKRTDSEVREILRKKIWEIKPKKKKGKKGQRTDNFNGIFS
jgi:hypothetical protein